MFRHAEPPSFAPTIADAGRLPPRSTSNASGKGPDLPSAGALEQAIQRRCLSLLVAATLCACAILMVAFAYLGQRGLALTSAAYFVLALVCDGWAKRSGAAVWPLRALAFLLDGLIVWHMLQQGPTLPAAAWWLSAMPLVLAAAGQFEMAIATVVAFLGIASWLQFAEPVSAFGSGPGQVAPWRHFLAVFGSQILALGVIVVSMRRRRAANEMLEQARRVAEEAAQTKSRFLANISHEIRNPLNVVVGTVPLLRSAGIDEAQRARLLDLQEISAKALMALVNDVLDWSKLEAGKMVLEARPLNPRKIVSEVNELFAVQAYAKGIELTSSSNPDVPRSVVGDATRLRQIVSNLVGNAVKFTSSGGVHIHAAMDSVGDAGGPATQRWLRIEVTDSGIGISARQLKALFKAFTQGDKSTTRRYGGTGLGLAISRELAQKMGGRIDVASVPGSGSTFALVVPLSVEAAPARTRPQAMHANVLLASSSPGVQRHLRTVLHDLAIEPAVCDTLPEGSAGAGILLLVDAPLLAGLAQPQAWLQSQTAAGSRVVVITPVGAGRGVDLPAGVLRLYKPVRRRAMKAVLDALDGRLSDWDVKREFMPTHPGSGLHVLVADDDPVNLTVVQAMLGQLGATSVAAANGREALLCLSAERFDLALIDLHMPELDGPAASRTWRSIEASDGAQRVPIVAMTGHLPGDQGAACHAAGMDGFLSKPFGMTELRTILQTWRAAGELRPCMAGTGTAP